MSGFGGRVSALFVGNSFTLRHDPPGLLARLSAGRAEGPVLDAERLAEEGASLQSHWDNGRFESALCRRRWDFVVLQDYSTRPLDEPGLFEDYARRCDGLIRRGGARTVLFSTWLARGRDGGEAVSRAYERLGSELGAVVARVGRAWRKAAERGLDLYDPDGEHAGPKGAYLTACVFSPLLLGRGVGPGDIPGAVDERRDHEILRSIAEEQS